VRFSWSGTGQIHEGPDTFFRKLLDLQTEKVLG